MNESKSIITLEEMQEIIVHNKWETLTGEARALVFDDFMFKHYGFSELSTPMNKLTKEQSELTAYMMFVFARAQYAAMDKLTLELTTAYPMNYDKPNVLGVVLEMTDIIMDIRIRFNPNLFLDKKGNGWIGNHKVIDKEKIK